MTLRPRFFDRLYVTLLVMIALGGVIMGALSLRPLAPAHLHCERGANQCTMVWPSAFVTDGYSYDLSTLKNSRTYAGTHGGTGWRVDWGTRDLWLAQPSTDPAAVATYTRLARDFQAFLADPSRTTFDGSYAVAGLPVGLVISVLAFGLVCGFFGVRWWRGWYAELEIDKAAGEITIHRRPMFFTGPRTVKLARRDLQLLESVEKRYLGRGQSAKFARFELHDTRGKRVFSYTTMYDRKSRAVLDGYMALLQEFFVNRA